MTYLGEKKIKSFVQPEFSDGAKHSQVAVEYEDGTADVVHEDEWACRTEEPDADAQGLFVKSTAGLQKEILEAVTAHNIKYDELGRVFDWVVERLNANKDAALSAVLGVDDWKLSATMTHLKELDLSKLSEAERQIVTALSDNNVPLFDAIIGKPWRNVLEQVRLALDAELEKAISKKLQDARLGDINPFAEITYEIQNRKDAQNVEGGGQPGEVLGQGDDAGNGEAGVQAQT
jgi:hypothetical protein